MGTIEPHPRAAAAGDDADWAQRCARLDRLLEDFELSLRRERRRARLERLVAYVALAASCGSTAALAFGAGRANGWW